MDSFAAPLFVVTNPMMLDHPPWILAFVYIKPKHVSFLLLQKHCFSKQNTRFWNNPKVSPFPRLLMKRLHFCWAVWSLPCLIWYHLGLFWLRRSARSLPCLVLYHFGPFWFHTTAWSLPYLLWCHFGSFWLRRASWSLPSPMWHNFGRF